MTKRTPAAAALALALLTTLPTACSKKSDAPPTPSGGSRRAGGGGKGIAFPVETIPVEAKPHELVVSAPGTVDAFEHIQVTARVAGVVDKVTFVEGQDVKLGQPLAYVDSRRYALAVSQAKAAVDKSSAQADDSAANLKRREAATSANPGLIPGEELETYRTQVSTARADVESTRQALKLAQLNLEDSTVKAAAAGIIQTRTVQTGQYVAAGAVIATLLRRDPLLLHFDVATSEAPRLKVGGPVEFTLKDARDPYTAKITLVGGAADPDSRLVPVTAQVDPAEHQFWLRPGSFAQVTIKLTSARQYPMIPQTAARPSDRGFLAFVVVGDVAKERTLSLGLHTTDGYVEVKSGLSAGEQLVTKGVEALSDGAKVRIGKVPSANGVPGAAKAPPTGSASAGAGDERGQRRRGGPSGSASSGAPAPAISARVSSGAEP